MEVCERRTRGPSAQEMRWIEDAPYVFLTLVHEHVELQAQCEKWQKRPRWHTPLFWKS